MNEMLPFMMMSMMNRSSTNRRSQPQTDKISSDIKARIQEIAEKQNQMLRELNGGVGGRGRPDYSTDRLTRKLQDMERRIERARRNKLRKKEKPGMPKFLMFMQQNMMNQMMLASQMQDPADQMDNFPKIIPVPVDPRKRVLPLSTNPFINYERNQPKTDHRDLVSLWVMF